MTLEEDVDGVEDEERQDEKGEPMSRKESARTRRPGRRRTQTKPIQRPETKRMRRRPSPLSFHCQPQQRCLWLTVHSFRPSD